MRRCVACGKPLQDGRRLTAKFCDATCRQRHARGTTAPTTIEVVDFGPVEDDAPGELISLETVAAELQRTLRSVHTPPSAKASLAREYRATLAEIEAKRPKARDAIDEIAERRAQRTGS